MLFPAAFVVPVGDDLIHHPAGKAAGDLIGLFVDGQLPQRPVAVVGAAVRRAVQQGAVAQHKAVVVQSRLLRGIAQGKAVLLLLHFGTAKRVRLSRPVQQKGGRPPILRRQRKAQPHLLPRRHRAEGGLIFRPQAVEHTLSSFPIAKSRAVFCPAAGRADAPAGPLPAGSRHEGAYPLPGPPPPPTPSPAGEGVGGGGGPGRGYAPSCRLPAGRGPAGASALPAAGQKTARDFAMGKDDRVCSTACGRNIRPPSARWRRGRRCGCALRCRRRMGGRPPFCCTGRESRTRFAVPKCKRRRTALPCAIPRRSRDCTTTALC